MTGYQKDDDGGYTDTRISSSNLKAALVGYNPIVGDTLRDDGPDPGMKMQIFEVASFRKVYFQVKSFLPHFLKSKLHFLLFLLPQFFVSQLLSSPVSSTSSFRNSSP